MFTYDRTKYDIPVCGYGQPCHFRKNLVSEAPLQEVSGVPMPTLEKLLVDILRDTDFFYLQGSESDRIIETLLTCTQSTGTGFSGMPTGVK